MSQFELKYTDVKEIPEIVASARRAFDTHRTFSYEFRKRQLKNFYRMLDENQDAFCEAVFKDLRKGRQDALGTELFPVKNEIVDAVTHLKEWMDGVTPEVKFINKFDNCKIHMDPFGVGLIIGAWNYPIQLTLMPMAGAIAAGNCVVLKPSECSKASAALIGKLMPQYLDKDCFKVVNGAVEETTVLLKERFDKILYTGNGFVGKIVMKAAAEHLTPVVLELGGKSPVIIDRNVDTDIVARRVIWGRTMNAGQTCIAPDYVLCHPESRGKLITSMKKAIDEFYGSDPQKSKDYCRIINARQFDRLSALLTPENGRVVLGGQTDRDDMYIAPTVIVDPKPDSKLVTDEIFGPILPILEIPSMDDAVKYINARDKPLALYVFSNDKKAVSNVQTHTSSGGFLANDVLMHHAVHTMPFGGVGPSGQGAYHGYFSFQTWSHQKATMKKSLGLEWLLGPRYPPFDASKMKTIETLMDKKLPKEQSVVRKAVKYTVAAGVVAAGLYYFAPDTFSRLTGR